MSLIKLAARLRRHDWITAVIEVLIVIAGILIALQVSNWNQDRRDRARADNYYQRIHAELVADRAGMDAVLKFWNTVSDYGRAAIAFGESGQRVDGSNWKTLLAYYQASQLMPFELEGTTFTEMRDSGDLALIADETLRKRLAEYYRLTGAGVTANILRHDPEYRMQVRALTPWRVQEYIWASCFRQLVGTNRQLVGTNQELIDCPSPISDEEAAAILESYRRSELLLHSLRYWISTLRVSAIVLGGARTDTVSLATDMEAARSR